MSGSDSTTSSANGFATQLDACAVCGSSGPDGFLEVCRIVDEDDFQSRSRSWQHLGLLLPAYPVRTDLAGRVEIPTGLLYDIAQNRVILCPVHRSLNRGQYPAAFVPSRASLTKEIYDEEAVQVKRQTAAEPRRPLIEDFYKALPPLECDFVHCGRAPPRPFGVAPFRTDGTPSSDAPVTFSAPVSLFFVVEQLFLKAALLTNSNYYGQNADIKERIELAMYLHTLWFSPDDIEALAAERPACLASTPTSQLADLSTSATHAHEH